MRIGKVDFPELVLSALERGRLVVFAGAGISVDPPSKYPNFDDLADRISGGAFMRHTGENIDRFLGRLSSCGVDVHNQVRDILSSPTSQPNHLHHSLVSLFKDLGSLRIVTTNFDRHLTTAATARFGSTADVFHAPALPLGSDFNGIVYVHGSVDKPAKTLVLTDIDFGRAYITNGWARQFLQALFATYTVLFIGYSHRDIVMNYLARGMTFAENRQTRFVLTLPGEDEHWENLGIIPVYFAEGNTPASKYAELGLAVASWAEISHLGALDVEQRIKRIVEGPVPLERAELDYVQRALDDISRLRFFVRHTDRLEWLEWMDSQAAFANLFQREHMATDSDQTLACWFSEKFVCRYPEDALALLRRRGFSISRVLWMAIAHAICRQKLGSEVFSLWVPILIRTSAASGSGEFLEYLLNGCHFPNDKEVALLLFRHLTTPVVVVEDRHSVVAGNLRFRADVSTIGSEYWLNSVWKSLFLPNITDFALQLFSIVMDHLVHAQSLLRCYSQKSLWDSLSFARGMIESHEQDNLNSGISVLVDVGAEIVRWSASANESIATLIPELWIHQESTLLRRLAMYSVTLNKRWSADEKMSWTLRHNLLYVSDLKHEFFLLIAAAYPDSSVPMREAFLSQVVSPTRSEKQVSEYERFNLLTWLTEKALNCDLAAMELAKIRELHPEFLRRERPDMNHWMRKAVWGVQHDQERVRNINKWSIADIISGLEEERSSLDAWTGEIHASLQTALNESLAWGVCLAREACDTNVNNHDLWDSLLRAWAATPAEKEDWHSMLKLLLNCPSVYAAHLHTISSVLERAARAPGAISLNLLPDATALADRLWPLCNAFNGHSEQSEDWLTVAINTAAGHLMSFYLHSLSEMSKGDRHDGIPSSFKELFLSVVKGGSFSDAMARVLLATHVAFLYSLDEFWTVSNVVPLLNQSVDAARAKQCWHGYVIWGRWTHSLMPHLLPLFVQQFAVLGVEAPKYRRIFCDRMAAIALFSEVHPIESGWLLRFVQTVLPEERLSWTGAVCTMLQSLHEQAQITTWTRWLKEYWTKRTSGVPVSIDRHEALAFTKCALVLKAVFDEAVTLVCSGTAPDLNNSTIYYSLSETTLLREKPEPMSRLLLFLLRSESGRPIYDLDQLHDAVRELILAKAPRSVLLSILDELARVGSPEASQLRKELDELPGNHD